MHGRPNRRNRVVFLNFSGLACTVGLTVEIAVFSNFSGLACTVGLTVEIELCFQISLD